MQICQFTLFVLMFGMTSCPFWGQGVPKKLIQESDFKQWETLHKPNISDDGHWVAYHRQYIEITDTLVVRNPKTNISFKISGATDGAFVPGTVTRWFVFNKQNKGVGVMDLKTGGIKWGWEAHSYKVTPLGDKVICVKYEKNKTKNLFILKPGQNQVKTINGITDFSISPNGKQVAYTINSGHNSKILVSDWNKILYTHKSKHPNHFYHNVVWNPQRNALSFMDKLSNLQTESESIISWDIEEKRISELDPLKVEELSGLKILPSLFYYSEDGSKLIFNITPISAPPISQDINVQEWQGNDPWVYPQVINTGVWENQWWKTVWWPKTNKLLQLGNEQTPQVNINPNEKYAVLYSQTQYEPFYELNLVSDLYAINLETGNRNLIIPKQEIPFRWVQVSPTGNYLSYFRDKQWWVYDFKNQTNTCITQSINTKYYSENTLHSTQKAPYGNPGWADGDKKILLYDKFDLWAILPNGTNAQRLTKGREEKITFRIDNYSLGKRPYSRNTFGTYCYLIENEPLLLLAKNQEIPIAYYKVDYKGQNRIVEVETGKIGNLSKAKNTDANIFIQESAAQPPALFYFSSSTPSPLKIYQSNPQQERYLMGKTERFTFRTSADQELGALLHFPDNFIVGAKYPMIVNIYEKKSQNYADYICPTYYEDMGFNSRVYTSKGYFVLEPDISYTPGAPGISAVSCVTTAVQEVLNRQLVYKDKVGLIGHSFGGYETAFIISQTDMFSAAVAGASVTDLTSYYFSIHNENFQPEFWRFENQQWRMGFSYFANKNVYLSNSPLQQADQVNCPLLLWAGGRDTVIPYSQSVELYLALRRLNKEVTFLLYPDEFHSIMEKKNQFDLSKKIKSFFDKHLK